MSVDREKLRDLIAAADTDPAALADLGSRVPSLLAELDRLEAAAEAEGWERVGAEMEAGLWEIRTRADKATEGPWYHGGDTRVAQEMFVPHELIVSPTYPIIEFELSEQGAADAEFAAAARTDVPKLLDALAAASKRIGELEAELVEAHAALAHSGGAS